MRFVNAKHVALLVVALGIMFSIAIVAQAQEESEADVTVAFVLAQNGTDDGWNKAHENGVHEAIEEIAEEIVYMDGDSLENSNLIVFRHEDGRLVRVKIVPDAFYDNSTIEPIVNGVIADGVDLLICTWFNSFDVCSQAAVDNPEINVVHISGFPVVQAFEPNFATGFPRKYQSDYAACYVAGRMGYASMGTVATFSIPEPVRGVDACYLGLDRGLSEGGFDSSEAAISIYWMNSWLDPEQEASAAQTFADQGVDIIAQWADTPTTSANSCDRGVPALGYGLDVSGQAPCSLVTSEWNWSAYYEMQIRSILDGTWEAVDWWGGFESNAVAMAGWNDSIPSGVRADTEAIVEQMTLGEFDPFCGPLELRLLGEDGIVPVSLGEGECLSDMSLLSFALYIEGMRGVLPGKPEGGYLVETVPMNERELFNN